LGKYFVTAMLQIFHNQARVHNEGSAYLEMNREREDAVILRNFSLVLKACSWAGPAKLRIRSAQDASQAQHDAMKGH
jgi:hypothetical protein